MAANNNQNWKHELVQYMAKGDLYNFRRIQFDRIPDRLFKYISIYDFDKKVESFVTDKVWVSDPATFNDPYDSALTIDGIALGNHAVKKQFDDFAEKTEMIKYLTVEEIEQVRREDDPIEGLKRLFLTEQKYKHVDVEGVFAVADAYMKPRWEKTQQDISDRLRSSLKMACFSEVNNTMLMWSHYASQHKGFCIEYNFKELTDARKNLIMPVLYGNNLVDVTQIIIDHESEMLLSTIAALHKSLEWQYEKEWRLIIPGGIIEKDSHFRVNTPKAVYIGSRMLQEHRKVILDIAAQKNIPAFEIFPELRSFTLSSRRIQ